MLDVGRQVPHSREQSRAVAPPARVRFRLNGIQTNQERPHSGECIDASVVYDGQTSVKTVRKESKRVLLRGRAST